MQFHALGGRPTGPLFTLFRLHGVEACFTLRGFLHSISLHGLHLLLKMTQILVEHWLLLLLLRLLIEIRGTFDLR